MLSKCISAAAAGHAAPHEQVSVRWPSFALHPESKKYIAAAERHICTANLHRAVILRSSPLQQSWTFMGRRCTGSVLCLLINNGHRVTGSESLMYTRRLLNGTSLHN